MPALFFPTLDSLRRVLASGIVPPDTAGAPARARFDDHGRLWLEPAELPARQVLTALARFGVQALGEAGAPTEEVGCWAELLPLRPAALVGAVTGLVLFEIPDAGLARLVASLRRLARRPMAVQPLPTASGSGRAWVTVDSPPLSVVLRTQEPESLVEAFIEQAAGVWVRFGWEHPLTERLVVPPGQLLMLRPPWSRVRCPGPVPLPADDEYHLAFHPSVLRASGAMPRIPHRLTLSKATGVRREAAWVFAGDEVSAFWDYCRMADERVLRRFEAATVRSEGGARVIVRGTPGKPHLLLLPLPVAGYAIDGRGPGLLVPADQMLRPAIRGAELTRILGLAADRVTWLEPGPGGQVVANHTLVSAFRPLTELLEHASPPTVRLTVLEARSDPFAFGRFAPRDDPAPVDPEELPVTVEQLPPAIGAAHAQPGWLARSLDRITGRLRRSGRGAPEHPPTKTPPAKPTASRSVPNPPGPVGWKLASADALLHGQARAARRAELESRLLAEFPRLAPDERAARWAELAAVYGATGNPLDAAVCWMNAAWEADTPPAAWLEQWLLAECRAARRPDLNPDLDRLLGEPGRFGAGRVLAAYTVWAGHQAQPPAAFRAALPRVLGALDQHFDEIPARAAWLARVAVTMVCSGDALGLARWRDRLLARLRDRGPGLDLDEPSFLRFHGTASPDRFRTAREWLAAAQDSILKWVGRLGSGGRLQWAGIDAETECTAEYARLLLAWGLGCLGERTRSRDWAARSRKALARAGGPLADPAAHALLADLFAHRIRDAQEGRPAKPGLPTELARRHDALAEFSRYAVDKLRRVSRVLEPADRVREYRGKEFKEFWGHDLLGERLHVLADRDDPGYLADEARQLLAACAADPSSEIVPRITLTLLEVAPHLDRTIIPALLGHVMPALDGLETWLQTGRWSDNERATKLPQFQGRLIESAFATAGLFNQLPAVRPLVEYLSQRAAGDAALRIALGRGANGIFRALRRLGYRVEAETLLGVLDPDRGALPTEAPFPSERVALAVGWFAIGDDDIGNRILDDARDRLFLAGKADLRDQTELAIAYASALGFAPPRIALGRLEEIFQRLDRVSVTGSTNRYYTLKPLELVDAVVRSVVTEDFSLGPAVRGWLDDDEFLIRRRVHRDMSAVLRDDGLGES